MRLGKTALLVLLSLYLLLNIAVCDQQVVLYTQCKLNMYTVATLHDSSGHKVYIVYNLHRCYIHTEVSE